MSIHLDPSLQQIMPETFRLIEAGNLCVHQAVREVVLGGSRGPRSCYRPDSDIDLSLICDVDELSPGPELGELLLGVLRVSLDAWVGEVEIDLAAVFDTRTCGLSCFGKRIFDLTLCGGPGRDCFGLYKIQKGFNGFVPPFGVLVEKMNPTLTIWRRA